MLLVLLVYEIRNFWFSGVSHWHKFLITLRGSLSYDAKLEGRELIHRHKNGMLNQIQFYLWLLHQFEAKMVCAV
jgi:hypothetical protein